MLFLVSSSNLVQLFLGWEGVGLTSYLLIGFWNYKDIANKAALKAFIVNRVGDFGLLLALFTIFVVFGTLNINEIKLLINSQKDSYFSFWIRNSLNYLDLHTAFYRLYGQICSVWITCLVA